jgi:hypothetical protein
MMFRMSRFTIEKETNVNNIVKCVEYSVLEKNNIEE